MEAHNRTDRHDHLPMAVGIIGAGTELGEQVGTAPEQDGDQREHKPGHSVLFFLFLLK